MKNHTLFQKLTAMLLSIVLVLGMVPTGLAAATDAAPAVFSDRVADNNTMNGWQDFFGPNVLSTEFAGGVWTDKSVFTNADNFRAEITMDDPENNFLIALSTIAANQQITGYSTNPVDVMLVLDVSGSMDASNKDTAMVQATNRAIASLLAQNNYNRVGVVLYSGNANTSQNATSSTATVILPLDRYTTTSTQRVWEDGGWVTYPVYFTLSNNTVSVASGVRNSNNQRPSGSKAVSGGTYIQNGLYKAWSEFSKVEDTKVPAGGVQAGAQRTPVMVLMSDGQPTLATDAYNNVGTSKSTYGDGQEKNTTWQTVFLTQLTAAFVKGKMEAHYGTASRFYTLGLGTGNSNYATAVLNPTSTSTTLDTYWNRFNSNTPDEDGYVNCGTYYNSFNIFKDSNVKSRYYSDYYGLASDTDTFLEEFQRIVDDIYISSAGHVTLVGSAGEDLSGYITFADELGCFMEVKAVKGLVMGANLYTGHNLASLLDSMSQSGAYGDEFVSSVQERLDLSLADAQALLNAAYADGQLFFDDKGTASTADDEFSNYIGWYSDDAGKYLGFWDKETGITATGAPAGATWINRSYIYVGDANSSDMMHVVVRVCTHIASGMQVVQYKVPASLIPKVTYEVELDGQDPTKMKSITRKAADPLRLVYEVGLRSDINSVSVHALTQDLPEGVHVHKHTDGTYEFFTNLWGSGVEGESVDYNDPLSHEVAQSHFHPAEGNGRYYYTVDTPVYVRQGNSYVLYTGTAVPTGDNYYHQYSYYTANGYTVDYHPVSEAALQMVVANGRQEDGCWYIPQGTVFQQIERFHKLKGGDANGDGRADANLTETLEYYDYPVVVRQQDLYDVYAFLGNNGKLVLEPAQGIRLTKQVTEAVEGAPTTFQFTVTLSQAVAEPVVTDIMGNPIQGWSVSGNQIQVELTAGQTVCITGIPAGVTYTVEEEATRYYQASSQNAAGTVQAYTLNDVSFTNTPKGYGQLIVSKDVDHPFTVVPDAMYEKEFTIHVQLSGADVANKEFPILNSQNTVTTDANGQFTVTLKDNDSVTVADLPEGTTFTVTETLDPQAHKGFAMDADRSVLSGTVVKDQTVQAHVVNTYRPDASDVTLNVEGKKILVDEAGAFDWSGKSFTVELQRYDTAAGAYAPVAQTQVAAENLSYAFRNFYTFDTLGTYYFKVFEQIPEERLEGMSYDASAGRIEVVVTDNDVDGKLEIAVYDFDTRAPLAESNGTVTYTKDFTNIHSTDATFVEFTVEKHVEDPHNTGLSEAGHLFELYEVVEGVTATTPAYSMRTVMVEDRGQAVFHIPATKVGVRTFLLKESIPVGEAPIPGMVYDQSVYTVTVTTTAENGKLVSTVSFTKDGQSVDAPAFTNRMDLEPLEIKPVVNKEVLNAPVVTETFQFLLEQTTGSFVPGSMPNGHRQTVTVGPDQMVNNQATVWADPIQITQVGTYYYRWSEIPGSNPGMTYDSSIYHVTVDVGFENGAFTKKVDIVRVGENQHTQQMDNVKFQNQYRNTDTEQVVFGGKKLLSGRQLLAGEFSFLLTGEGVSQTVTNLADGTFTFAPITYTVQDVGEHVYTVTEVQGDKGGITYDSKRYEITVTVADDGQGNLVVTTEGAQDVVFNNTYSYGGPVGITLSGNKSWLNTDSNEALAMEGGEFAFELYTTDETYMVAQDLVASTTNAADGSFCLGVSFDRPGTHYYLLKEQIPAGEDRIPGAAYDTGIYEICVQVYDTGLGALKSVITHLQKKGTGETDIRFSNTYTPAPVELTLEGSKTLTGRQMLDGEFEFVLEDENGKVLQRVNNLNGKFTFAPLTFDKTGTYKYRVWENIPEAAAGTVYEGVQYDDSLLMVTVTVTDDGNGQLKASYTVTNDGAPAELAFENRYTVTGFAEFSVEGEKILSGKQLQTGEFTFEMFDANGDRVAITTNDANGGFAFRNVPVTAEGVSKFTVQEKNDGKGGIAYDGKVYTVEVTAADDGKGGLKVENVRVLQNNAPANGMIFTNTYTVEPTYVELRVQKNLQGDRTTVNAGEFSFVLMNAAGAVVQTKENLAGGAVVFDALRYTEAGEYRYTVMEVIPADAENNVKNGITYDTHVCKVTVVVTDNGDGTFATDVTYEGSDFTNTYKVTESTTATITGTKVLVGKDLEAGKYTFQLFVGEEMIATATNDAQGKFTFPNIPLASLGEHTFTVKEATGDLGGITYDSAVYTVTVTTSDNGVGGMTAGTPVVTKEGQTAELVFTNTYKVTEPTTTTITGTKKLLGVKELTAGLFSFQLYKGDELVATVSNAADGSFAFENVALDSLGEHVFTVKEVIPADAENNVKDGITYDPLVYTVKVNVTDNGEGGMTAGAPACFLGEPPVEAIVFTNRYDVKGTSATITGTKILTGKTLEDNMFAFELLKDGQRVALAQNVGSTFTFENIPLETLGDHVFTVRELVPEEAVDGVWNGVTYSGAEYVVDVKLTTSDNGVGGMTVSAPAFTKEGQAVEELVFENSYAVTGTASVTVEATKTLTGGKPLADGAFTFELYEGDVLLATATNDADGKIVFADVKLDALGEHVLTVKERQGNEEGITYSDLEYTVTVDVADNGDGTKVATIRSTTLNGQAVSAITFENVFRPGDITLELNIEKTVENKTEAKLSPEGFVFLLLQNGEEISRTAANADGKASFPLKFTADNLATGTFQFQIKELDTDVVGVTYSEKVYDVTVVLTQDAQGQLQAKVQLDGEDAEAPVLRFVNTYAPPATPPTGDLSDLGTHLVLLTGSTLGMVILLAVLVLDKRKKATK